MKTTATSKHIRLIIASTLVACLGTLGVTWPGTLHADDEDQSAERANEQEIPPDATEVDGVLATTEFVTDKKHHAVHVRLVASNPSQEAQVAKLGLQVQQYEYIPMARSAPPPEVRFEQTVHIIVPPGDRFEKELYLPKDLAQAILTSQEAQAKQAESEAEDEMPAPSQSFEILVQPVEQETAAG